MAQVTTASKLIKYRNELIKGGVPEDEATYMTRDAAGRVIQSQGLTVEETSS